MLLNNNYFTIVGPTASGKTSLAIEVAKKINGEIIGLDSRQIYKGMKIGTAQPSTQERGGVIHHLIGCLDPWVRISAGQYAKKIHEKIHEIENKGKVPLICGGAGLYYRAITMGLFEESSTNIEIRKSLEINYEKSPETLMEKLDINPPLSISNVSVWRIDQTDGFKFILKKGSWLAVRPSGTDNIIRIYAESKDKKLPDLLIKETKKIISQILKRK